MTCWQKGNMSREDETKIQNMITELTRIIRTETDEARYAELYAAQSHLAAAVDN